LFAKAPPKHLEVVGSSFIPLSHLGHLLTFTYDRPLDPDDTVRFPYGHTIRKAA